MSCHGTLGAHLGWNERGICHLLWCRCVEKGLPDRYRRSALGRAKADRVEWSDYRAKNLEDPTVRPAILGPQHLQHDQRVERRENGGGVVGAVEEDERGKDERGEYIDPSFTTGADFIEQTQGCRSQNESAKKMT